MSFTVNLAIAALKIGPRAWPLKISWMDHYAVTRETLYSILKILSDVESLIWPQNCDRPLVRYGLQS